MPAVSSARRIVGTIASRWARLATSGTTPPKRACSSTLVASASASSSVPRTMPTPVSSHDVSMPRTSGASEGTAHHHRVDPAVVVIAAAAAEVGESVPFVQLSGGVVVDADLEEQFPRPAVDRSLDQVVEQPPADTATARVGNHADRQDFCLISGYQDPCPSEQGSATVLGGDVAA